MKNGKNEQILGRRIILNFCIYGVLCLAHAYIYKTGSKGDFIKLGNFVMDVRGYVIMVIITLSYFLFGSLYVVIKSTLQRSLKFFRELLAIGIVIFVDLFVIALIMMKN